MTADFVVLEALFRQYGTNVILFSTRIPVSNTVTALEVWLLACMLLVFLSLVEYAVILRQIVLYKRKKDRLFSSHNPLCDFHHPYPHAASSNSNSYTTINYNHPVQVSEEKKKVNSCSILSDVKKDLN